MLIQIIFYLFCLAAPLQAQHGDRILPPILPSGSTVSATVIDADSGILIYGERGTMPLKPASNIKIFSTGAALVKMGPDYNISTSLCYDKNKVQNGTLNAPLYIKGEGNALFDLNKLDFLAGEIKRSGIIKITDGIIFDNSFFDKTPPLKNYTPSLSPLDIPCISPISINRNIIEITFTGNKTETNPASKYLRVEKSAGNIAPVLIESGEGYKIIIPSNKAYKKIFFFIKKPELFASLLLKEKLEERGITVEGKIAAGNTPKGIISVPSSVNLAEYIIETNKLSNNFLAINLKQILSVKFGNGLNGLSFTKELKNLLESIGVPADNIIPGDGAGISPRCRLTTEALARFLRFIYKNNKLFTPFYSSLSIAGIDGTLKEQFFNSPLKNNLRGKSGFMMGVSSISGYFTTRKGKHIIAAVIINYKKGDIDYYRGIERKLLEEIYNKF